VLTRARFRCEPCGVSADGRALEVGYIVPCAGWLTFSVHVSSRGWSFLLSHSSQESTCPGRQAPTRAALATPPRRRPPTSPSRLLLHRRFHPLLRVCAVGGAVRARGFSRGLLRETSSRVGQSSKRSRRHRKGPNAGSRAAEVAEALLRDLHAEPPDQRGGRDPRHLRWGRVKLLMPLLFAGYRPPLLPSAASGDATLTPPTAQHPATLSYRKVGKPFK
jgi:hypothetical protein